MKRILLIIGAVVVLSGAIAFAVNAVSNREPDPDVAEVAPPTVQKISAEQAKTMMADNAHFILLDVRSEEEFQASHIAGATLIPDYQLSEQAAVQLPDQDALIIVYCRSGVRSSTAAQKLADLGYTKVYDMGGLLAWPFETVNAPPEEAL